MKHSPLPWSQSNNSRKIVDKHGNQIATCDILPEPFVNAPFIISAANYFDELRFALEEIKRAIEIALDEESAGYIGHNLIVRDRLRMLLQYTNVLSRIEEAKR